MTVLIVLRQGSLLRAWLIVGVSRSSACSASIALAGSIFLFAFASALTLIPFTIALVCIYSAWD